MKLAKINQEQRLYVQECGPGFTCLGFEYAHKQTAAVAKWLNRPDLMPPDETGTEAAFNAYHAAMKAGAEHHAKTGQRCNTNLTPQLFGFEGCRVEVISTDGEKRRFQVGKSTGWMPCHLELANRRSSGGHSAYVLPSDKVRLV